MESNSQDQGLALQGLLSWGPGSTALGPRMPPAPWAEGSPPSLGLGAGHAGSAGARALLHNVCLLSPLQTCVCVCKRTYHILGGLHGEPATTESRHRMKTPEGPLCLQPRLWETRERIGIVWSPRTTSMGPCGNPGSHSEGGWASPGDPPLRRPTYPSDWPAALSRGDT